MARISTYGLDNTPSTSDKWIGTDSATGQTKNFSVESIINLINDNAFIDQFDGVIYEFTQYESSSTTQGIISVSAGSANVTDFQNVNTIYLSKKHATGDSLDAYIDAFLDGFIKINQQGNLGNFGIYQVTGIEDYDTYYKKINVIFNTGVGQFTPNARYFVSNYQSVTDRDFSDDSITEFGDVTDAGSGIIISDIERTNYNEVHTNAVRHSDVVDNVTGSGTDVPLSANQGRILKGYIDNINSLLASDDISLDELQEVVDYIKANRDELQSLGISNIAGLQTALDSKVDKIVGKQLSTEDFTTAFKTKLEGVEDGAEVNVQADWNQGISNSDSFIQNKPTDVTDLSLHVATELSDINSSGSGYIITDAERTRLEDELVEKTQTIRVHGTTSQVNVSPDTAQTLATSRSFQVSLTDSVSIVLDLSVGRNLDVTGQTDLSTTRISTLTDQRVLLAGTSGLVEDSANLTFTGSLLSVTGSVSITNTLDVQTSATIASLSVTDITNNRVVIGGANGELEDDANLTFDGTTLGVTGSVDITGNLDVDTQGTIASLRVSDLTNNRVVLAGVAGELEDDTNLTFDGTLLNLGGNQDISGDLDVDGQATLASANVEDLVDNQLVVSGPSGELEGDANLTFDGTELNVGQGNASVNVTTGDIETVGSAFVGGDISLNDTIKFTGSQTVEPNISNGIYVAQKDGHDILEFKYDGHRLTVDTLTEEVSTGILVGGELSIATDTTQFTIQAGRGIINELNKTSATEPHPEIKYVDWDTQTITISNLTPGNTDQLNSWIYIDNTGAVQQQSTPFTDAQYRNAITIGSVIHSDGNGRFARTFPITAYGSTTQFNEFIRFFGPLKREGHAISANGNNLSLNRSSGKAFALGRNYVANPNAPSDIIDGAKTQCVIHRYYQDGSGGFIKDDGPSHQGYTTIDPTKFDNGSGTPANMPNNKYSIQRIYYFPSTPDILVVYYGRDYYDNKDVGERSIFLEDFKEADNTAQQAIHVATILVKKETTDLTVADDSHIYQAGLFRNLSATFSGGVDAGAGLNDLSDVNVSSPEDGQALVYDADAQQWINGAGGGGGGGDIALYGMVGLEDVYYALNLS